MGFYNLDALPQHMEAGLKLAYKEARAHVGHDNVIMGMAFGDSYLIDDGDMPSTVSTLAKTHLSGNKHVPLIFVEMEPVQKRESTLNLAVRFYHALDEHTIFKMSLEDVLQKGVDVLGFFPKESSEA